jgi:hypothetical protein
MAGQDTKQFKAVNDNLPMLQRSLRVTPGAVNSLETQFCQERWLDIVDLGETSANGLIKKALVKIEEDIKNYEVFMKMLKGVVGIQGVVDKIIEICPLSPTEGADSRATVHHGREQVDGPTHGLACFTDWMTARDGKDVNAAALWASKNALWPKGKNIKVRFLGGKYPIWRNEKGKPITEGDILSIANSWHLSGDVPEFIEWKEGEGASDIRVRFVENGRSKSQVGTAAEKCAADEATMWLDLASPPHARLYYKHLILHEFGHALGLEHEHQRDDINKLLDDRKLKEYLKKIYPQMSDKEMNDYIESNWKALTPEVDAAKSKCPDVDSIMYYWLPADADVTGYEKPKRYPYELSVGDKKYIVQFYSGAKEPMETDDVSGSTSGSGLPDGVITDDHGGGLASVSEPQQSAAAPGILGADSRATVHHGREQVDGPTHDMTRKRIDELQKIYADLCSHAAIEMSCIDHKFYRSSLYYLPNPQKEHKKEVEEAIEKAKSADDDVIDVFEEHHDYLNYSLLKHVIDSFGSDELKKRVADYAIRMEVFRKETRLEIFSKFTADFPENAKGNYGTMKVTFDMDWATSTLDDVEQFRIAFCHKLSLQSFSLSLFKVHKGSLVCKWEIISTVLFYISNIISRCQLNLNFTFNFTLHFDYPAVGAGGGGESSQDRVLDVDTDVHDIGKHLKDLQKDELKHLFRELGLYSSTVENTYAGSSRDAYADDLIRAWILGKDGVLLPPKSRVYAGGATRRNLKKALTEMKYHGVAARIK